LILKVKFHSLYVKESESEILERSESRVTNFGKVRYSASDSATLIYTTEKLVFLSNYW